MPNPPGKSRVIYGSLRGVEITRDATDPGADVSDELRHARAEGESAQSLIVGRSAHTGELSTVTGVPGEEATEADAVNRW